MADQVTSVNIIQIKDLTERLTANPDFDIPFYNPLTQKVERIKQGTLLSGTTVSATWLIGTTYAIDAIVQANSKWWQSLQNGNLGNYPTEGAYWTEVSRSLGDGKIANWSAGVYTSSPTAVVSANALYLLNSVVALPFNSTDFAAELALGEWIKVGISELQSEKLDSYPDFPIPPIGQVLSDDGTFKSVVSATAGYVNGLYLDETASDIPTYKTLAYTFDLGLTEVPYTVIVGDGDKLVSTYLYPFGFATTEIPAGVWSYNIFCRLGGIVGVTNIGVRPFKYTTLGDKTYITPAIVWSIAITTTTTTLYNTISTEASVLLDLTDRLGCDIFLKTTAASTRTVTYSAGDGYASFIINPSAFRHSILRDKDEEAAFQHITSTQKTAFIEHIDGVVETKHLATQVSLDTTTFDTNLDNTIVNVQLLAEAVDELVAGIPLVTATENNLLVADGFGALKDTGVNYLSLYF